jgi:hypothetical protein
MNLIYRGVLISEAKLVIRNELFFLDDIFNRFNRSFSNSFDRIGNNDIGLYDVASCVLFAPHTFVDILRIVIGIFHLGRISHRCFP